MSARSPLRMARVVAGLTLEEVAEPAGISASYLSLLERGLRPLSDDVSQRLRGVLGDIDGRHGALLEQAAIAAFVAFGRDVAETPTIESWRQAPEDFRITFRMVADAVLMVAAQQWRDLADDPEDRAMRDAFGSDPLAERAIPGVRSCRECGCTDVDACVVGVDVITGAPIGCSWAEPDLCTACVLKHARGTEARS